MARLIPREEIGHPTLDGRTVAILGYGNQGRAQALNLKDSGVDLVVGQRPGPSWDRASAEGMRLLPVSEAAMRAEVLMFTLPDEHVGDIYAKEVAPHAEGKALLFTHGFGIHFGFVRPPSSCDVCLVAPKGQAKAVRERYLDGQGVPGLISVHQDASGAAMQTALAYAHAAGYTNSVLFETTFAEETETDLFGEQAVLCGGMIDLMIAGFDTLIEAGYSPEMAYFECVQETKLIIDLVAERGFAAMRKGISDTAEWGGYLAGRRLVTDQTRQEMKAILAEIRSGEFARDWVAEARAGKPRLTEQRAEAAKKQVNDVGDHLRQTILRPPAS